MLLRHTGIMSDLNDVANAMKEGKQIPIQQITIPSYVLAQEHQFELSQKKAFKYLNEIFNLMIEIDKRYQNLE